VSQQDKAASVIPSPKAKVSDQKIKSQSSLILNSQDSVLQKALHKANEDEQIMEQPAADNNDQSASIVES